MKKLLLVNLVGVLFMSCSSATENNSEAVITETEVTQEEEYQEDETFTAENILGKWSIIEFDSELDGANEMMGKTYEFTAESLTLTYITDDGLKTVTATYELYSEDTIKATIPIEKGSITIKFKGFIQSGKMRLNSSQGSILLQK